MMATKASASDVAYVALEQEADAVRAAVSNGDGASAASLLANLRKHAAEAAETLGTYDARRIGETIDALTPDVATLRRRPKFSFRARATAPTETIVTQTNLHKETVGKAEEDVVQGREGQRLIVTGTRNAMRIRKLMGCVLFVRDTVSGSVLIQDCTHCVFVLTARQIRIHDCESCLFLIDATTAPVIERCTSLVFGPRLRAPSEQVMNGAEVLSLRNEVVNDGEITISPDSWRNVKDFNWLRASPSPNWRILADDGPVDVDNFTVQS